MRQWVEKEQVIWKLVKTVNSKLIFNKTDLLDLKAYPPASNRKKYKWNLLFSWHFLKPTINRSRADVWLLLSTINFFSNFQQTILLFPIFIVIVRLKATYNNSISFLFLFFSLFVDDTAKVSSTHNKKAWDARSLQVSWNYILNRYWDPKYLPKRALN